MRFLQRPQPFYTNKFYDERLKGARWCIVNEAKDIYYLKEFQEIFCMMVLQELEGHYCIVDNQGYTLGFDYERIETLGNYLIAFFREEQQNGECFHVYNKQGNILKYEDSYIIGTSYDIAAKELLVNSITGGVFLIDDVMIQHVKKACFITSAKKGENGVDTLIHVGTFMLKDNGIMCIEYFPNISTNIRNIFFLTNNLGKIYYSDDYQVITKHCIINGTPNAALIENNIKVLIQIDAVKYIICFNIENEKIAMSISALQHEVICDWCEDYPWYVLFQEKNGKKVLYNVKKSIFLETKGKADTMEITKEHIIFYKHFLGKEVETESYRRQDLTEI